MTKIGDRVKHINPELDKLMGVMTFFEIKCRIAFCTYADYDRLGSTPRSYPLTELNLK
jgi:hypothetical protein